MPKRRRNSKQPSDAVTSESDSNKDESLKIKEKRRKVIDGHSEVHRTEQQDVANSPKSANRTKPSNKTKSANRTKSANHTKSANRPKADQSLNFTEEEKTLQELLELHSTPEQSSHTYSSAKQKTAYLKLETLGIRCPPCESKRKSERDEDRSTVSDTDDTLTIPNSVYSSTSFLLSPIAFTPRSRNELGVPEGTPNSVDEDLANQDAKRTRTRNRALMKFLQRNFTMLKSEMEADEMADYLFKNGVLTYAERTVVENTRFRDDKNEFIIMCIVKTSRKQKADTKDLVRILTNAMKQTHSEHLLRELDINSSECNDDTHQRCQQLVDSGIWKRKLDAFLRLKGTEINPTQIIDQLLCSEVITFDEHENVKRIDIYPKKFSCLIEYIKQKSRKEFDKFVEVIGDEYPEHRDGFNEDNLMETANGPEISPFLLRNIQVSTNFSPDSTDTGMVTLQSQGNGEEVERNIVDRMSSRNNPEIIRQGIDFAAVGISNIKFSSVHITINAISKQSQMLALESCRSSPEKLLKFLQSLFTYDDIRRLHQRGVSIVHVKVNIMWPDCSFSRKTIIDNFCFLKENMPDVVDTLSGLTDIDMEKIKNLKLNAERNAAILIQVVNSSKDLAFYLYNAVQKSESTILRVLDDKQKEYSRSCCCRLTKDLITKSFTTLTERMVGLKTILRSFIDFPSFQQADRIDFQKLLLELTCCEKSRLADGNDKFLRKVLEMECKQYAICLLEEELHRLKQEKILQEMLKQERETKAEDIIGVLKKEDISRNQFILLNEVEPRRFVDIFEDKEEIRKLITSTDSRRDRCKTFLDALKGNSAVLNKFAAALDRSRMKKIMEIILEGRRQGSAEAKLTKADIRRNEGFLKEEIDPRKFLKMLRHVKLRGVKNSDEIIEKILSSSPKRQHFSCFIAFLLDGPDSDTSVLELFQRELVNLGINQIYEYLINSRDTDPRQERMKEAVITLHASIVEEIETERLRPVFIGREVLNDAFFNELLRTSTSRRDGATMLLKSVVNGRPSLAHCLINAMEAAGYSSLVKKIYAEIDNYHSCPRLYKVRHGIKNGFTVEGEIQLNIQEDSLPRTLCGEPSAILPVNIVDQMGTVQQWIDNNRECMLGDSGDHNKHRLTTTDRTEQKLLDSTSDGPSVCHSTMVDTVGKSHHCRRASGKNGTMSSDLGSCKYSSPDFLPSRNIDECYDESSRSVFSAKHVRTRNSETTDSTCSGSTIAYGK